MRPQVVKISEADPARRRIHVRGEAHPGELAERGYVLVGEDWVLEIRRPRSAGRDADPFIDEFRRLRRMGYEFAEGDEWSPAEIYRRYADLGLLRGDF